MSALERITLAKNAADSLAQAKTDTKNEALRQISLQLNIRADEIIAANDLDIANGKADGMTESLQDRLRLDHARIDAISKSVSKIISLPDPIGDVIRGMSLPNALRLTQVRVPLGLIGVIYEARPNVTIDIAAPN
jgi:glutamate-5-semialdehyde dehydrogenase